MTSQLASAGSRPRPGGRSTRVRRAVLEAAAALLAERGYDGFGLTDVARSAAVHPTTVYRRWGTKRRLVGELLLERGQTLSRTPDTGSVVTDLEQLLRDGSAILRTPPVRALFEVLLASSGERTPELSQARERFWTVHEDEARALVARAVARGELPAGTPPLALIDLVVGPALVRL